MNRTSATANRRGFTLMETVIAIGVLAVLLTAFLAVFTPAAQGIRKAISVEEADRLAFALERELVTLRESDDSYTTGFAKAYDWIENSYDSSQALLVFQYRGDPSQVRGDGTMEPYVPIDGVAGEAFVVQPVIRRKDSATLEDELKALEGRVYTVKLTQLIYNSSGALDRKDSSGIEPGPNADSHPDAYVAFAADFYRVPTSSYAYIQNNLDLDSLENPIFSRNLAVRR